MDRLRPVVEPVHYLVAVDLAEAWSQGPSAHAWHLLAVAGLEFDTEAVMVAYARLLNLATDPPTLAAARAILENR